MLWFSRLRDYGIFDFYHANGCVAVEDSEDDFSRDGFCYVVFYEGRTVKPEVVGSCWNVLSFYWMFVGWEVVVSVYFYPAVEAFPVLEVFEAEGDWASFV